MGVDEMDGRLVKAAGSMSCPIDAVALGFEGALRDKKYEPLERDFSQN